jgi:hypothetical protein
MLRLLLLCLSFTLPTITLAAEPDSTNPFVIIETSEGNITVELFADKAPVTVANFLSYVDSGFYTGTIFHRVIPNFMIQGGGFLPDMTEKKKIRIPLSMNQKIGCTIYAAASLWPALTIPTQLPPNFISTNAQT